MWHAKPVIATGYSGNLEFMDESNAWLVPYELVSVPAGCDPYPTSAHWADPSTDAAADAMLEIYQGSTHVTERAQRGRDAIQRLHTPVARARLLVELLQSAKTRVVASRSRVGSPSVPASAVPYLAWARWWELERRLRGGILPSEVLDRVRGGAWRLRKSVERFAGLGSDRGHPSGRD
jgi:hypothetical protein